MKRYVAEPESDLVRTTMAAADGWFTARISFVETVRAVGRAAGSAATRVVRDEWPSFEVIEIDQAIVEHAAELALDRELRTLDSLHLAAALALPDDDLVLATWDHRLHGAARAEGLDVLPETVD